MNGTEAQVAAAEQIISETVGRIETYLADGGTLPADFQLWQITRATAPAFVAWVRTLDDAPTIIDWFGARTRGFRTLKVVMAFKRAQVA